MGANQAARHFIESLTGERASNQYDLLAGQFNHLSKSLMSGKVVKVQANIEKGLTTEYFVCLMPTHSQNHTAQYKQHMELEAEALLRSDPILPTRKPSQGFTNARVFRDAMLRHNLRLGKKAIQRGLPVMLIAGPGMGKNRVAEELHDQLHAHENFINFNCSTAYIDPVNSRLIAKLAPNYTSTAEQGSNFGTNIRGTLYLDRIDLLDINSAPILNELLDQLIQPQGMGNNSGGWVIISSTETNDIETMQDGPIKDLHLRLSGFLLFLPQLKSRSDFRQLCESMVASISSLHSLSSDSVDALRNSDAISNLSDLDWSVRTLLTYLPEGVIRSDAVVRTLGQRHTAIIACPRCVGRVTKEARCLQIRQMIRQCNGNIALAARSLRVSRNTVYLHAPGKSTKGVNE